MLFRTVYFTLSVVNSSDASPNTFSTLGAELLVFAALLVPTLLVGSMLCPYVPHEIAYQGAKGNAFGQVMMTGFFLGVPLAWMLCCLALRGKGAYLCSLVFYISLSYAYGYMMFVCTTLPLCLFELTDAYLLILVFPMFHHIFLVPFMLLFNIWLSRGKLPVSDHVARRFGRHALLMLAVLWATLATLTLLPRL